VSRPGQPSSGGKVFPDLSAIEPKSSRKRCCRYWKIRSTSRRLDLPNGVIHVIDTEVLLN
jgi:hypothetical protein